MAEDKIPWFSVDPSSTRTGWAEWNGTELVDVGAIRGRDSDTTFERCCWMADVVMDLLIERHSFRCVVEVPSGKPGRGSESGARGRLAVYGMAVGIVLGGVRSIAEVVTADERQWTRGKTPAVRRLVVASMYPQVAAEDGPGDIVDAVSLGLWWIDESRIRDSALVNDGS